MQRWQRKMWIIFVRSRYSCILSIMRKEGLPWLSLNRLDLVITTTFPWIWSDKFSLVLFRLLVIASLLHGCFRDGPNWSFTLWVAETLKTSFGGSLRSVSLLLLHDIPADDLDCVSEWWTSRMRVRGLLDKFNVHWPCVLETARFVILAWKRKTFSNIYIMLLCVFGIDPCEFHWLPLHYVDIKLSCNCQCPTDT